MIENVQLNLANEFVQYTNRNIFLTGKAGTGKTTFLHKLRKNCPKRIVVVAPTGVAAINAGGATIHSFFQLAFGPYIPGQDKSKSSSIRIRGEKINLIKSIDLLVIDEISMVRADTLDHIDEVLRRYRDKSKPFGGVQLLMIGDLHQLAPVVKDDEWAYLKDYYKNPYFFSSNALQQTIPVCIELKHIYRQSDDTFINLLNSVRENRVDADVLQQLNQRYIENFNPNEDEGYITLTSHNYSASQINDNKLKDLKGKVYQFKATVNGDFPEISYPNAELLDLKVGAQVMFVKNDISRDKLFFNGKIGKITKIEDDVIVVKCPQDLHEIFVRQVEWQNIKYELNSVTKEIEEKQIGSFVQYPLRTAWAITIHKSQGLTFEKAIIDANAAFAHGQVYVALSRCKTFEGMVLRTPISYNSVKTDGVVASFTRDAENNAPKEEHLNQAKQFFQQGLLFELFDFNPIKSSLFLCKKLAEDHYNVINVGFLDSINEIRELTEKDIYTVADSFKKHLNVHLKEISLPEENNDLQERVKKASAYFIEKLDTVVYNSLEKLNFDSDNKSVKKSVEEALLNLKKEVFIKKSTLIISKNGFETLSYIKARANAEIDFLNALKVTPIVKKEITIKGISHIELFKILKEWRDNLAADNNVPVYMVFSQKVLTDLANSLPSNFAELESIKGIGKAKIKQYGNEILTMINDYCEKNKIVKNPLKLEIKAKKTEKIDTKQVTFNAFKEGKSVEEIALDRNLVVGTIESHLVHFVGIGELDIYDWLDKDKVNSVRDYIVEKRPTSINTIKEALSDDISYGDIRAVMKYLEQL